jgi:hypothetical protein
VYAAPQVKQIRKQSGHIVKNEKKNSGHSRDQDNNITINYGTTKIP